MFSLSEVIGAAGLDALESVRPKMRHAHAKGDPRKAARKAARQEFFNASIKDGLRRSRRVKIFCT